MYFMLLNLNLNLNGLLVTRQIDKAHRGGGGGGHNVFQYSTFKDVISLDFVSCGRLHSTGYINPIS